MRYLAIAFCAVVLMASGCDNDVTGPSGLDSSRDLWTYVGSWQGDARGSLHFGGQLIYPMEIWTADLLQSTENEKRYLLHVEWTDELDNTGIAIINYYIQPDGMLLPAWTGGIYLLDPSGSVYYRIAWIDSSLNLALESGPFTGKWWASGPPSSEGTTQGFRVWPELAD
jgi:hypothetical protein